MTNGAIELKREGIKIAYRRFLSDSAAGFIVILLLLYVFHSSIKYACLGDMMQVFLYFLLFLISTPLGLAINAVSYRFGEMIVHYCENRFVKLQIKKPSRLKTGAYDEFLFNKCKDFFQLSDKKTDWIDVTRRILRILEIYYPDRYEAHNHEIGVEVFFRNLAFIIFFILCFGIWQCFANGLPASIFCDIGHLIFDFNIIGAVLWSTIGVVLWIIFWWRNFGFGKAIWLTAIWLIIGAAIWRTTCPLLTCLSIWLTIGLFIFLIGLFLWLASYISYYYHLAMLCEAYNLCLEKPELEKPESNLKTDQIIKHLIGISKKAKKET